MPANEGGGRRLEGKGRKGEEEEEEEEEEEILFKVAGKPANGTATTFHTGQTEEITQRMGKMSSMFVVVVVVVVVDNGGLPSLYRVIFLFYFCIYCAPGCIALHQSRGLGTGLSDVTLKKNILVKSVFRVPLMRPLIDELDLIGTDFMTCYRIFTAFYLLITALQKPSRSAFCSLHITSDSVLISFLKTFYFEMFFGTIFKNMIFFLFLAFSVDL